MTYNHASIEEKWQQRWENEGTFVAAEDYSLPKYYNLQMYPYPSGDLHMGHLRNYTYVDLLTRYRRMQGYNVLAPMGWDSFGLPAENGAIASGVHPRTYTEAQIERMKAQLKRLGAVYDWTRELACHTPEYYRWDQWLFLQLFKLGLAYKKRAPVNWCPNDQTVLANEQVVEGDCERCGTQVVQRELKQWFFRITEYAQRLLDDLEQLDSWPERVRTMQANWIGRSEGVTFRLPVVGSELALEVFTTRPDTIFGMTFAVIAPEHPQLEELLADSLQADEVRGYVERAARLAERERVSSREKSGVYTGRDVHNPVDGKRVPVFVADYVLMGYGTGAIMGVPGQDQRDWEFAVYHGLDIIRTVQPPVGWEGEAYTGEGETINSGFLDGLDRDRAIARIADWLEEEGWGTRTVNFRLRDWLISRQRYWGCPIPIVSCPACGLVPVPDQDLPVIHPQLSDFSPQGRSPLASSPEFVSVTCPQCGEAAERETDTMDTFVDSSWYFIRFCDPHNSEQMFDPEQANHWLPVDQYIGGVEHAVLHLLYARFITKVLYDQGMLDVSEPFARLFTQGMLVRDGAKMSKSKGNVVPPDRYYQKYGADAIRLFELFIGPPTDDAIWSDQGVEGTARFLDRIWRMGTDQIGTVTDRAPGPTDREIRVEAHRTLEKVTGDFDRFSFNTAVAALMGMANQLQDYVRGGAENETWREVFGLMLLMLAPMAPHLSHELWERSGREGMLALQPWPRFDPELVRRDRIVMVIQVNGKVRDKLEVDSKIGSEEAETLAIEAPGVQRWLDGKHLVRVIARPPRLVNLVVKESESTTL